MPKKIALGVQVIFLREGESFIAHCPALDLATNGDTFEQAQSNFREASRIFMEHIFQNGTVDEVLESLGWEIKNDEWSPPMIVSQETIPLDIPRAP
jgi:predicted RNase H-like HicB family nuclease